ncbi:e3 ubiquitin-protein ligase herc2 [Stylonychia lemnae]|uniref:E3 ubiquitin-protein ligase herc2 n=1 Tax=Stylonychia lemnae TaxID=5949 RepID=A0A077ZT59_STYLE|nr:e3 ubiquitin-protein ligase herc2 [Stylonychia lemnae]|eukprot:CDW71651.1 e3 ubiquitin-protein ligase herc2 [Stylonychia lemnae]
MKSHFLSSTTGQKINPNNCKNDFDFYLKHYCWYQNEKGDVYTWGSGEMGQLGYNGKVISMMPKDREGYPFQVAGGDGHTVAVDIKGNVYSWGASACGQLGLASMKDLPTDVEGYPYQPTPRIVELLQNVKVIQIACGDAHTVALSQEGKLYSWGGGGCGQLGHPDTSAMPKDEDGCPYQPKPKLIVVLKALEVRQVACGKAHTVAVLANGHLYSWGAGACGQLGHPDTSSFPADEDGYPYQPIPRCALKQYKLIHASCGDVHTMVLTDQGEIYCFGGGSCGQLGFGNIAQMPLDVDSCPFMPVPKKAISLSCGDSHSMALSREGHVYAWGEATYGQLGLDDIRDLPKNSDNKPYQPFPQKVLSLLNKKIVAISCGETHTLALTEGGHLYSFGGNTCGQLGQYVKEQEKGRRKRSFEDIVFPKNSIDSNPYSFMSNSNDSPPDTPANERKNMGFDTSQQMTLQSMDDCNPLNSPPSLFTPQPQDYGIDSQCMQPRLIKSLMHRKIIKISSGGVHNICIVDPYPSSIMQDVYQSFMQSKYTDVIFKGFYTTFENNNMSSSMSSNHPSSSGINQQEHQNHSNQHNYGQNIEGSSDEDMKDDYDIENNDVLNSQNPQIVNDQYWREKEKTIVSTRINAHQCVISHKSPYFYQFFLDKQSQKPPNGQDESKLIVDFNGQVQYEAFRKIVDYIYLDDLNVLDAVADSTEMIEIIKLAKQYNLEALFKACEVHFKELMVQSFDCTNLIALKFSGNTNQTQQQKTVRKINKQDEPRDVRSSGRAVQQVSQSNTITTNKKNKKLQQKLNNMLQGLMFLPDGRVLIMDSDLYKQTIERSIVLDLFDGTSLNPQSTSSQTSTSSVMVPSFEEEKSQLPRIAKDNHQIQQQSKSKQNQANQRKKGNSSANDPYTNESLPGQNNNGAHTSLLQSDSIFEENIEGKKDFLSMLNSPDFSDITLIVDGHPIYSHQVVLASRSIYFEALFSHDFKEKEQKVVNFTDVPYDTFMMLLKHIYSDSLKIETKHIYDLLSLADRFNVVSFKKKCEHILAQCINVENVCQIFKYANTFNCERLKESCLLFTEENHNEVISSPGFEDLDKDEILKIIRVGKESKRRFKGRH